MSWKPTAEFLKEQVCKYNLTYWYVGGCDQCHEQYRFIFTQYKDESGKITKVTVERFEKCYCGYGVGEIWKWTFEGLAEFIAEKRGTKKLPLSDYECRSFWHAL
jgi:hypothetical protein